MVDAKKERKNNSCLIFAKSFQNRTISSKIDLFEYLKKEVRWLIEKMSFELPWKNYDHSSSLETLFLKTFARKPSLKHSFFVIKHKKGFQAYSHIYSVLQDNQILANNEFMRDQLGES